MGLPLWLNQISADLVLDDTTDLVQHRSDWSGSGHEAPDVVLAPRNSEDVAQIMHLARQHATPIIVQGGMTGLAGGANGRSGALAVSLQRMNQITDFDPVAASVTVGAGAVLESVQTFCANRGFLVTLDLGARGSAQIGGTIATNAGGMNVLRYGMARSMVLGLEVVLADGTILSDLRPLRKKNAGYDLNQLFIGSEGTLGIITRAVLQLVRKPVSAAAALAVLPNATALSDLYCAIRDRLPDNVTAFEVMAPGFAECVRDLEPEFVHPVDSDGKYVALVEVQSHSADAETLLEEALADCLERELLVDAAISRSDTQRRNIWRFREIVPETLPQRLKPYNMDISLPPARIADFTEALRNTARATWPDALVLIYGHFGDGNLHITFDATHEGTKNLSEEVLKRVHDLGGIGSAEHGIGVLKADILPQLRSRPEIATMRALKALVDPNNLLNPGRVLASQD